MTRGWVIGLGVLTVYSVVLVGIEWNTSQDYVRHFVTDVEGPVPFYAVNTTLSVFLLWTTAVLFGLGCRYGRALSDRDRWFLVSQCVVFAFLGFDDRFKVHETLAAKLSIGDHWILLGVAVAEVAFLAVLAGWRLWGSSSGRALVAAAGLFTLMIGIDALGAHDGFLRLSLEDVAKTWAAVFFLRFGLCELDRAVAAGRDATARTDSTERTDADVRLVDALVSVPGTPRRRVLEESVS